MMVSIFVFILFYIYIDILLKVVFLIFKEFLKLEKKQDNIIEQLHLDAMPW